MCNIGKIESVRSVQALIFASSSNFFPKVCSCRFDMRLHIDNFYPGLLLLRAWAFCGKRKPLTWLFCFGLFSYLIVLLWGYRSIIMVYTESNEESQASCAKALSNTRRTVGVSLTVFAFNTSC